MDLLPFQTDPIAFFDALTIPSAHGPQRFADCMADFQRERFASIAPALVAVATGQKPPIGRHWWEATKGGSKDSDLACCLLWLLAFSKRPLTCQVGAADLDQADELKKAAKDILRLTPWLADRVEIQSWKILCKATDSYCEIIASDVHGSHGARPDVLILNELSHITKLEFAENLMDNAAKVPHGLAVIATNSGFTGTWQERWREIAETSDRWVMNCFSRPAPWLDDADVEEAERRNSNARFQRLFWGVWASSSGDALDKADVDACTDSTLGPMGRRQRGHFYIGGLDLGIKHDHSALVVIAGRQDTQELRLAYAESWAPDAKTGRVDLIKVESTVLAMHRRYDFDFVGFDIHQAELMSQRLQRQRVPMLEMKFQGENLNKMASTLLDVFRSRRIRLYDHKKLISDLGRLTITEKSYGYKLEAVSDTRGHADLAIALAIALPIAVEKSGQRKIIIRVGLDDDPVEDYTSPFAAACLRFERHQQEYADEQEMLREPDNENERFYAACREQI